MGAKWETLRSEESLSAEGNAMAEELTRRLGFWTEEGLIGLSMSLGTVRD